MFDKNIPNDGIYIHWDRMSTNTNITYEVLRSKQIDGNYDLVANVDWPINDYVDTKGHPSYYYKITEKDNGDFPGSPITGQPLMGEEILVLDSLLYQLNDLLNIPIYDEECTFSRDRTTGFWAFNTWNYHPKPQLRISGGSDGGNSDSFIILSEDTSIKNTTTEGNNYPNGLKYKLDYRGKAYFIDDDNMPVAIQSYDIIYASYYVRMFTGAEINNAAYMALQAINMQPGTNKYNSLGSSPPYYDPAVVSGACYYLLRGLMIRLGQRETRLLIQDPDSGAYNIIDSLKDTMKSYKDDFDGYLKVIPKAQYPKTVSIVTPEYMMPGGRSRFFRMIWKGGGG
jgi:hypothetical protein